MKRIDPPKSTNYTLNPRITRRCHELHSGTWHSGTSVSLILSVSDLTRRETLEAFLAANLFALLDVPCDQEVHFSESSLSSGLYVYRIEAGNRVEIGHMTRVHWLCCWCANHAAARA